MSLEPGLGVPLEPGSGVPFESGDGELLSGEVEPDAGPDGSVWVEVAELCVLSLTGVAGGLDGVAEGVEAEFS